MTVNIDLLDAELKVAQTECDDIDTAMAQIAAEDADAKAKFIELSEQHAADGLGGDIRRRHAEVPKSPLSPIRAY